jgi:4-carboxymuconolactone decarboxylase
MITDGYGKVLSRPGLELRLRELSIVVTCAVLEQDRQLHAHLHGALNAGATPGEVGEALALVSSTVPPEAARRFALLWNRVRPE